MTINGYLKKAGQKRWRPMFITGILLLGLLLTAFGCSQNPQTVSQIDLPAYAHNSQDSLKAYRISTQIPDVLAAAACYCGCGETLGHRNLKDCFLDDNGSFVDHASNCHICQVEAIDVGLWNSQGMTPQQIAAKIDAKYQSFGNPTIQTTQETANLTQTYHGGPRIVFSEDSVDMGEMTLQNSRSYSFNFENDGDAPLKISNVSVRLIEGC